MRNICWLNNDNICPPALCAWEAPDEKLKINELGPNYIVMMVIVQISEVLLVQYMAAPKILFTCPTLTCALTSLTFWCHVFQLILHEKWHATPVALFPGPAQLFVVISTEKRERAWYLFSHE